MRAEESEWKRLDGLEKLKDGYDDDDADGIGLECCAWKKSIDVNEVRTTLSIRCRPWQEVSMLHHLVPGAMLTLVFDLLRIGHGSLSSFEGTVLPAWRSGLEE